MSILNFQSIAKTFGMLTIALVVSSATLSQSFAQDAIGEDAAKVLDDYAKAVGGEDAFAKLKTRKVSGTVSIPAAGLSGKMVLVSKTPNMLNLQLTLPGVGEIVQICDGENVYEKNPLTGERMLEGKEKAAMMLEASSDDASKWRELYESAKVVGEADVEGSKASKIEIETKSGLKLTNYYDQKTKLLVKTDMTVESVQGKLAISTLYKNYKEVDGIKMAFESVQSVAGMEQKITIDSVEHDVELPAKLFEIPEIK